MSQRTSATILAASLFIIVFAPRAGAQIASTIYSPGTNQVTVSFTDDVKAITFGNTLVFFEDDSGRLIQLLSDGELTAGLTNAVNLKNFRDISGNPVSLITGGGAVLKIPAGQTRTYNIILKGVRLSREPKARPLQTSVEISSATNKVPLLTVAPINLVGGIPYNRRAIDIHTEGIQATVIRDKFQGDPSKIKISYKFNKDDPALDVETSASSVKVDAASGDLIVEPRETLPFRAKKYTVKVLFPTATLRSSEQPNYQIPADAEVLPATAVAELVPSGQTERAKTEFYVETTFTSTVNPKDRKRAKIGIFGIHWRPTLPLLTSNVFGEAGNKPTWMAFRPLLEADFDTQSPKVSKSPNRIQFGMDHEWGRDAGLQEPGHLKLIQQIVWINGIRYDSDRDFKLQTIYWHTEFAPRFLNFEQTTEERQYAFDLATQDLKSGRKGPVISSYRFKPSIGYELGGLVRRDSRATNVPTNTISRPFVALDLSLELQRIIKFGFTNTYYFLENATRRRHRDYAEARVELNTGFLFNRNFNGLQNAITLKFQRGDQPPTFGSVNALSLGFKIFR